MYHNNLGPGSHNGLNLRPHTRGKMDINLSMIIVSSETFPKQVWVQHAGISVSEKMP